MSAKALSYVFNDLYGSNDKLKIYYDFDYSGIEVKGAGFFHTGYVRNIWPSCDTGMYSAKVMDATGWLYPIAFGEAYNFLQPNGSGNFTQQNMVIEDFSDAHLNDSSFLFSFSNTGAYKNGILLGALERYSTEVFGASYLSSSGFNLGVNDRGKLFFQSIGPDGEFVFTANNLELSQKNIVSLSVGGGRAEISRFDYFNNTTDSEFFVLDTDQIFDTKTLYLGTSPTYFRAPSTADKTFSGYIDAFVLISGSLPKEELFKIGSGLISEYSETAPSIVATTSVTGAISTPLWSTPITYPTPSILGYIQLPSGFSYQTGVSRKTAGTFTVKDGERYYKYTSFENNAFGSGFYKEELGYLTANYTSLYSPTGDGAYDTLGLQTGDFTLSSYSTVSGNKPLTTVSYPVYAAPSTSGYERTVTGYSNTLLYGTSYATGAATSGIFVSGESREFKKDFLYFLEERI